MNDLPFPLYHGTSTLFLKDILEHGLGGKNPLAGLNFYEFSKEISPLIEEHLEREDEHVARANSFFNMVSQRKAVHENGWNWTHGATYLSPSESTAARYSLSNPHGSEFLSYGVEFLRELVRRNIPGVADNLYRRYPQIFNLLDISPAPIIIEINQCPLDALLTEQGNAPDDRIYTLLDRVKKDFAKLNVLGQQDNFYLKKPIKSSQLKFWLVNTLNWSPYKPSYQRILLDTDKVISRA